jgi:oligopeptide transport system substrate-binding protein
MSQTLRKFGFFASAFLALSGSASAKILHMRLSNVPSTLDWTGQVAPENAPIVVNVCEGLFRFEYPGEKLVPALAESVTRSKDLKTYTFKIRGDAKWSDGRAVYAQDFVEGWERVISSQTTSIYSYYFFDIVNARAYNQGKITSFSDVGIKSTGDRTLVVRFSHPVKNWEMLTTFWPFFPVRKDTIEKFGNNWWKAGVMLSSGPFLVDSYEQGTKMTLKRNPFYPKTKSNVDEVDVDFVESNVDALAKYEAGVFPMINGLPFSGMKDTSKRADFKLGKIFKEHMLSANVDRFPMSNREFRLAILQAIDPHTILPIDSVQFEFAASLVPPPLPGSQSEPFIHFDPVSAKAHLKKSGVVLDKNFKLQFLTSAEEPFSSTAIEIKNQIEKNIGVHVQLMIFPNQDLTAMKALREFHLIDHSQTLKVSTSEDILKAYTSDSMANERHYSNPIYDQWVAVGNYKEAQEMLIGTEAVSLPLYYEKNAYLMNPKLSGVYLNAMGFFYLRDAVMP